MILDTTVVSIVASIVFITEAIITAIHGQKHYNDS